MREKECDVALCDASCTATTGVLEHERNRRPEHQAANASRDVYVHHDDTPDARPTDSLYKCGITWHRMDVEPRLDLFAPTSDRIGPYPKRLTKPWLL